jgi:hypothetical protein
MRTKTKLLLSGGIVALVAVVAVLVAGARSDAAASGDACCFANGRYEGICTVVPAEGETCDSILAYLNNPMSAGKSYCGSTDVRGGWTQVDCKTGKSAMQPGASGSTAKAGKR